MCAIIAQFIRDLLDFAGLSSNLAYITSVTSATSVLTWIGSLIKRFAKKAGEKMQEINNQRKASSICWRGRRELITDVRKPEIHGYDVIVGGELFTGLLRSPSQTCHAKPKTQINRRRTLPAFPVGGMPTASSLAWKTSLRKVVTLWHCSRLRSVALLPMIDRGDIRQAIDRCSNIWASLPGAGYGQFGAQGRQPDCKIQRSGRNGQRDWCMSRVTAIISALVICIIVCSSWAVNWSPW